MLLVGGGLLLVVALFFLLVSGKGNPNVNALAVARELSRRTTSTADEHKANVQAALDHLTQYGVPSDVDSYRSVAAEIEHLKESLLSVDETATEEAALKEYKLIENAFIEKGRNHRTEESLGQDLIKWADKYKGSRALGAFLANYKNPNLLKLYMKTKAGGTTPPK